jgi:hypothetical protein
MTATTLCLIAGGLFSALAAALAFAFAARAGHLDDLEETKFHMLREDERR